MKHLEHLTTTFPAVRLDSATAEATGQAVYRDYLSHTEADLSHYARLSFCVRRRADIGLLAADDRARLVSRGYLRHGDDIPLQTRLRARGVVAVAMVVPEIEDGDIVGEHLEEPFRGVHRLAAWDEQLRQSRPDQTRLSWLPDDDTATFRL